MFISIQADALGYILPYWGEQNLIDYKIADGSLYCYDGNGFSEDWIEIGRAGGVNSTAMNQIPLTALNISVPVPLKPRLSSAATATA